MKTKDRTIFVEHLSKQRPNRSNEVVSVATYVHSVQTVLRRSGGIMRKRDLMSRASEDFDHMWSKVDRQVIQRRFRIPRWKNLIAWALVNLRKQRLVAGRGSKLYLLDSRYISQRLIRWAVSGRRKRLRKIKIGPHSLRKQLRRTVLTK